MLNPLVYTDLLTWLRIGVAAVIPANVKLSLDILLASMSFFTCNLI